MAPCKDLARSVISEADAKISDANPAAEAKIADVLASRIQRRRDGRIPVVGLYFLGQMDRNMFNDHYGRGYFIYVDGGFHPATACDHALG